MSRKGNSRLVLALVGVVVGMTGLSFASVPLYRKFCQVTGFGGTTQRAEQAPSTVSDKWIFVRFNADVSPDLDWSFEPEQREVRVHPGEQTLVAYRATNHADHAITGTATYNVTPSLAGLYFDKIQCFCFTQQTLAPGETAELPVTFFVDPDMLKDRNAKDIPAITLSYTFFQAKTRPGEAKVGALPVSHSPSSPSAKETSQ
ncbi:MAG TPA: cytochrome c oxidase assembly protein [Aliidongia sp.]|nr:cytochrome c oxidase assembly protein [Aliidongia sp.]